MSGTPPTVVARLNAEINKMLNDPAIAQKMQIVGPIAAPGTSPKEFETYLLAEHKRLGQVAAEIGLLPE